MLSLLQPPRSEGYPSDFLFSRLRGKRQQLFSADSAGNGSSRDDQWQALQSDYHWLFGLMNPGLRRIFAPVFLYCELRNLHLMLRAIVGKEQPELARLCRQSLLNKTLLKQLQNCESFDGALSVIDTWMTSIIVDWELLTVSNDRRGTREVEQQLVDGFLRGLSARQLQPDIAAFMAGLIDSRNILTVARYLRWDLDNPPILDGGTELSRQLENGQKKNGRAGLQSVVSRYTGEVGADVALLEIELRDRFSRQVELAGRDPLGIGLVLDYLWRCYLAFVSAGLKTWTGEEFGAWEQLA